MPKTVKEGPLRFLTTILLLNLKKNEGEPIGVFGKFSKKKQKNEKFQQSHSAEKSERRDPLRFFNIPSVAKYKSKLKGGPFEDTKKIFEKNSHKAEKGRSLIVPKK